jgi:hypothetical protein
MENAPMIGQHRKVDPGDGLRVGPDPGPTSRTPLRVYVAGVIVIGIVALFVVQHLMGGGPRQPPHAARAVVN